MRVTPQIHVLAYYIEYAIVLAPVLSRLVSGEWSNAIGYSTHMFQTHGCGEYSRLW